MQNPANQSIVYAVKQPSANAMKQRARRFRNVHLILTISAGLVVLVSLALGGLGWRLLSQEQALQQQQARDALEGKANILQTQFFSTMRESDASPRGLGITPTAVAAFTC